MPRQLLSDALTLTTSPDGASSAVVGGDYSNGRLCDPPEAGFPFGGLLAALTASAMRDGLAIRPPLRSLSVQYLAAPSFGEAITFQPRMLRGGRSVAFTALDARQGERMTHHAQATWGGDDDRAPRAAVISRPTPLADLDKKFGLTGDLVPRFSQAVEYRFPERPGILSGRAPEAAIETVWMRANDGAPLDEIRLCYLMDALYPPAWLAVDRPVAMATVDLRYDILGELTPDTAPDGWAFFEWRLVELANGWTLDDLIVRAANGSVLALGRQRRKLAPVRHGRTA